MVTIKRGKDARIYAFAINIGTDSCGNTQLSFTYHQEWNGVFLSFDFSWLDVDQGRPISAKVKHYADHSAQMEVDSKPLEQGTAEIWESFQVLRHIFYLGLE